MQIKLKASLYSVESILTTCYTFLSRGYFFLDADVKAKTILVYFKPKKKLSLKNEEAFKSEFMNSLLHSALRYRIGKNNRKIREYIIGRALYQGLPEFINAKQPPTKRK